MIPIPIYGARSINSRKRKREKRQLLRRRCNLEKKALTMTGSNVLNC